MDCLRLVTSVGITILFTSLDSELVEVASQLLRRSVLFQEFGGQKLTRLRHLTYAMWSRTRRFS